MELKRWIPEKKSIMLHHWSYKGVRMCFICKYHLFKGWFNGNSYVFGGLLFQGHVSHRCSERITGSKMYIFHCPRILSIGRKNCKNRNLNWCGRNKRKRRLTFTAQFNFKFWHTHWSRPNRESKKSHHKRDF